MYAAAAVVAHQQLLSCRRSDVAREAARPSVGSLELVRDAAAGVEPREPLGVVSASPRAL